MKATAVLSACAVLVAVSAVNASAADAAAGKAVFARCAACHAADDHTNRIGPHLGGVFGRKAASVPGFNYSSALKKAGDNGLVWTKANLEKWLTDPRSMVPGTRMVFPGIKDKGERDNVIAYLQSITPPK